MRLCQKKQACGGPVVLEQNTLVGGASTYNVNFKTNFLQNRLTSRLQTEVLTSDFLSVSIQLKIIMIIMISTFRSITICNIAKPKTKEEIKHELLTILRHKSSIFSESP